MAIDLSGGLNDEMPPRLFWLQDSVLSGYLAIPVLGMQLGEPGWRPAWYGKEKAMKMLGKAGPANGIGMGVVLLLCVVRTPSHADELLLVPPELRPTNGLFYSFQNPDHPPLPQNIFPELPLYWVEDDSFLIDDEAVDYEFLQSLWTPGFSSSSGSRSLMGLSSSDCGELTVPVLSVSSNMIWTFSVTNVPSGTEVDVFGSYGLGGPSQRYWYCLGRATNGQVITVTNLACWEGYFMAGCTNDTDGDGLTDAYELLVTKTSPDTNHSVNALYTDAEMENVLVNDLRKDCGTEQNTQFETTCVISGTNIIVAWVDSNKGVYGLGGDSGHNLDCYTPQLVAYAVSKDGGHTFVDMGEPPLSLQSNSTNINDNGDAGDPVLAVDRDSGAVYLVGTSVRNDGHHGIPVWKSTDGGVTFGEATNVLDEIEHTDKPWVAVDDWPGTGQDDVYVISSHGSLTTASNTLTGFWLTVSTNVAMNDWSDAFLIRQASGQGMVPVIGPDHVAYTFWLENESGPGWLIKMCPVSNRGATTGAVYEVYDLATTGFPNGDLKLKRSNTAASDDTFKVPTLPAPAVNPARTGHLYVAFADVGTNANDRADVFLSSSTDSGVTWTNQRVNMDSTTNDQWMPVLAVKPDGEQLFMAWYDRRRDTNNGWIEVYGCFGAIETDGSITLTSSNEFKISTSSFPMVFVGTRYVGEPIYAGAGYYDPVYPPGGVNLHWWYPEWPTNASAITAPTYIHHVGEYNGAYASEQHVLLTWTDYRLPAVGSLVSREQSDVRFIRLAWP
jgi:hypothetical protein